MTRIWREDIENNYEGHRNLETNNNEATIPSKLVPKIQHCTNDFINQPPQYSHPSTLIVSLSVFHDGEIYCHKHWTNEYILGI